MALVAHQHHQQGYSLFCVPTTRWTTGEAVPDGTMCGRTPSSIQMDYLTAPLLRDLIDHIDVFETEGIGKNRTQRIVIYYRFVGYVEIPAAPRHPHYKADTRQGVAAECLTEPKTA